GTGAGRLAGVPGSRPPRPRPRPGTQLRPYGPPPLAAAAGGAHGGGGNPRRPAGRHRGRPRPVDRRLRPPPPPPRIEQEQGELTVRSPGRRFARHRRVRPRSVACPTTGARLFHLDTTVLPD